LIVKTQLSNTNLIYHKVELVNTFKMNLISKCLVSSIMIEAVLSFTPTTTPLGVKTKVLTSYGPNFKANIAESCRGIRIPFQLKMTEEDDFYADYDPSSYQQYERGNSYDDGRRDHDYTRDTSRDRGNVDENAVNQLLSERVQARKSRDFDRADEIRDQLMIEYQVGVYDRERTWRTGVSNSGSGRKFGGGEGRGDRGGRKTTDFGPNGHDYYPCEDAGGVNTSTLTEPEIHELLADRLQAKLRKDFDTADGIQYNLIESGVFVHDGNKQWRADGVPFGDMGSGRGPGKTTGSRSDRNRDYTKSVHSPEVEGIDERLVDALVKERQKCKLMKSYGKADAIREGLRNKYNILIDDRLKEWSIGGDFGEEHNAQRELSEAFKSRGYIKSASSSPLSPEDEEYITARIEERSIAKKNRDFETADYIRDELNEKFYVVIQDKLKQWSVGGDFGPDGPKPRGVYKRRGGGNLTDEEVEIINKLLSERSDAKQNRDFDTADYIRLNLRDNYNIQIDDKSREWHVDSPDFVQVSEPGAAEVPQYDVDIIEAKIAERHAHKINREYEAADFIRDELNEKYGIKIDDRTKEWRCVLPADEGAMYSEVNDSSVSQNMEEDLELDGNMDAFLQQ